MPWPSAHDMKSSMYACAQSYSPISPATTGYRRAIPATSRRQSVRHTAAWRAWPGRRCVARPRAAGLDPSACSGASATDPWRTPGRREAPAGERQRAQRPQEAPHPGGAVGRIGLVAARGRSGARLDSRAASSSSSRRGARCRGRTGPPRCDGRCGRPSARRRACGRPRASGAGRERSVDRARSRGRRGSRRGDCGGAAARTARSNAGSGRSTCGACPRRASSSR